MSLCISSKLVADHVLDLSLHQGDAHLPPPPGPSRFLEVATDGVSAGLHESVLVSRTADSFWRSKSRCGRARGRLSSWKLEIGPQQRMIFEAKPPRAVAFHTRPPIPAPRELPVRRPVGVIMIGAYLNNLISRQVVSAINVVSGCGSCPEARSRHDSWYPTAAGAVRVRWCFRLIYAFVAFCRELCLKSMTFSQ